MQASSESGLLWVIRACATTQSAISLSSPRVNSAAGSIRMTAPLPASHWLKGVSRVPFSMKFLIPRRQVSPTSTGLDLSQAAKFSAIAVSDHPPVFTSARAMQRAISVSSVTWPGFSLSHPPPTISFSRPYSAPISPAVMNSTGAPRASPIARPMKAARARDLADIRSRARAAFIGLAIGDALGAPVEFMTAGEIGAEYGLLKEIVGGGWLRLKPGQVTDDTEMALCIARALVKAGGWSLTAIAENFATWLKSKPVDVGDTCRRGIRNFMLKGTLETPFNQWDAGSIYLGRLIHLALCGATKNRLRQELEGLFAAHENFRFHNYQGLSTGYVVDTMQTVFHYFFRSRDFEECLVRTVNQGGDADTTGAIIGAIAGAYYGMEEIPKRWLKKMDRHVLEETDRLAARLIDLSPLVLQIIN